MPKKYPEPKELGKGFSFQFQAGISELDKAERERTAILSKRNIRRTENEKNLRQYRAANVRTKAARKGVQVSADKAAALVAKSRKHGMAKTIRGTTLSLRRSWKEYRKSPSGRRSTFKFIKGGKLPGIIGLGGVVGQYEDFVGKMRSRKLKAGTLTDSGFIPGKSI